MPMDGLEELSRKALQALAKEHGIKANLKSIEIISQLRALPAPEPEPAPPKEAATAADVPAAATVQEAEAKEAESETEAEWVLVESGGLMADNGVPEPATDART